MGQIFMSVSGNGHAYVTNYNPSDGDRVFLHCMPDSGEILQNIIATDSWDNPIALYPDALDQSFIFRDAWRNMYIEVYFSGSQPPHPPGPQVPPWLYFKFRKKRKRYVK